MTDIARPSGGEAIVYDPAIVNQTSAGLFDPSAWPRARRVMSDAGGGGRGSTYFVCDDGTDFALRHYYRGGLIGRFVEDQYLWFGEARTRSFREFALLREMCRRGLPVPRPAAARYRRSGIVYRADLLTVRLAVERSLAEALEDIEHDSARWHAVGVTLRRFHDAGVYHADLNAHNILLNGGEVSLIDFDRGELRSPGHWREANLARLDRSLRKVAAGTGRYTETQHRWLRDGYDYRPA